MKYIEMRPVVLVLVFLFSGLLSAQEEFHMVCKDLSDIIKLEKQSKEKLLNFRSNPQTQDYDIVYHRIFWEIDPAQLYIKGRITSHFIPTQKNFLRIHFDLDDNLLVNEVRYHNKAVEFDHTSQDLLTIKLPQVSPQNMIDSITIEYEGIPESYGFGPFIQGFHQNVPVIWSLSEPYGAKNWWPCKQDLIDKIDSIDIFVQTPSQYKVGSNGILKNIKPVGDHSIHHWKHRYPIPAYLVSIAVTNYEEFSDYVRLSNGDSVQVLNYVYPESLESAKSALKATVEQMELFNELFGDYPFADEKYGHAQFSWGGGMEHQTMSSMGSFSYGLQAHELAHQWFGDKVTCGSWEDIWLNEGFATYLTALTHEHLNREENWNSWKRNTIKNITNHPGGSVKVTDTTKISRIFSGRLSYNKGAFLLHMLRWVLGDENFYSGVRNYINDPELAFGFAKTRDLKHHLEKVSGKDLTEFFGDWYEGEGYPSYTVIWNKDSDQLRIQLFQSSSHESVDFFEMPVPIKISGSSSVDTFVFDHQYNGQVFEITFPEGIEEIVFDPEHWILSNGNVLEEGIISDINEENANLKLTIYPNPAQESLKVTISEYDQSPISIRITNSSGHIVNEFTRFSGTSVLDLSGLASGVYFIEVETGQGFVSTKFIRL